MALKKNILFSSYRKSSVITTAIHPTPLKLIVAFLISVFFLVGIALFNTSFAQQTPQLNLTVSPPVLELVAKPGDKLTERFRVRNNGNQSINLNVQARRLVSDPLNGSPIPEDEANGEELKWVSFSQNSFTALPNEWTDITFTIDIPESAAHGYYYVFRIAPTEENSEAVTGAQVKGEILVVTLLTVQKEGAKSATQLVNFKANNFVTEYLPTEFTATLKNTGNVHVKPRGNIFIKRGDGEEIAILEVNEGLGSILPGGTREFTSSWSDGFIVKEPVTKDGVEVLDDNGKPKTKLTIHWNKLTDFRIGPYTAQLFMIYDDGQRDVTIEATTTFWVIPYTALAVIIITLIVVIVLIRFLLKWYVGRAIKNSRSR